ncbi:hypothetical protein KSP40_PGU011972 [Platanthera guangdongensis]|uniref:CrcB-like protein n=1 Tax=Platanthera guangdongensis TaxID=2320717 RepID=A0ABR2MCX5_9ASPA
MEHGGTRQIMDSANNDQLVRSTSSSRVGIPSSFRTLSCSSSLGGSISAITNESLQNSLGRNSGRDSRRRGSCSLRRDLGDRVLKSISLSRELAGQMLVGVNSSLLAQTGDTGDRIVVSGWEDDNENWGIPTDNANNFENGFKYSSHDPEISSDGIMFEPSGEKAASPAYLLEVDRLFPPPGDLMLHSAKKDKIHDMHFTLQQGKPDRLSPTLDYISYLVHLAVFGILGVMTRYLLQKLFGPNLLALTGDATPLYLDLPSNMLGSFLMGWFGIVFKPDLRYVSEHLVVGITTGYMGSLTTFSGWNQKMLDLSAEGHWTFAVAGIILGMFIVNECVTIGVESAEFLRSCFSEWIENCSEKTKGRFQCLRLDTLKLQLMVIILMLVIWVSLSGLSCILAVKKMDNLTNGAVLWLGCLLGPFGVWARWYLSRLNGQGLGIKGSLKWLPIGTLLANFLAAFLMAALSTISNAVNTKRCRIIVSGVQFGFLGCMSTVSTFVAEVYAMRQSRQSGKALAYTIFTILPPFLAGILIYSIPVWTKHYT